MYKQASQLYPGADWYDYQPIVEAMGTPAIQCSTPRRKGDTWVLYHDGVRFGYLCFGWGSCSGCDALQRCSTLAEVDELIADLAASVRWFDGPDDAREFFRSHDWEGDYGWHEEEFREFVEKARAYLDSL